MSISLKQLEIFRAVVVSGSITKASRRVGLSQPTISQQIAKIEEILDVQLLVRNRSGVVELTTAGEYWFKAATDLTKRFDGFVNEHHSRFGDGKFTVRLGTTPTLRGRFASAVARLVLDEDRLTRFELSYGINSSEVVNQLRLHQINFAIVNSIAIEEDHASNVVTPVFQDKIAWAVPDEIPHSALVRLLSGDETVIKKYPALGRFATIGPDAPMQPASDNWYRHFIPNAEPTFGAMTYITAVELVAEGLCTSHCPLSLLPNLPGSVSSKLRWYVIPDFGREIVLVVPKHLLSLGPYSQLHGRMLDFIKTEYSGEMTSPEVMCMTTLLDESDLKKDPRFEATA